MGLFVVYSVGVLSTQTVLMNKNPEFDKSILMKISLMWPIYGLIFLIVRN